MVEVYKAYIVIINILLMTALLGWYTNYRADGNVVLLVGNTKHRTGGYQLVNQSSGGDLIEAEQHKKHLVNRPPESGLKDLESLLRQVSVDDVIVMAVLSDNMVEMAMNFYFSSIVRFNITNFVFFSMDQKACDYVTARMTSVHFYCYVFKEDKQHVSITQFDMSGIFARRTQHKPEAASVILSLGYDVLITDLDIVYLRNPLVYLSHHCTATSCDVAIEVDVHEYNSGFIYARPTKATMNLFKRTVELCREISALDQTCFNKALQEIRNSSIRIVKLGSVEFPTGKYAFPAQTCPTDELLKQAYIIHGNWLKFHSDKIHRFKDCLLWQYDGDDGYYSNPDRRYVTYTEVVKSEDMTLALLNLFTLGWMLGRTPILPRVQRQGHDGIDNSWKILKGRRFQLGAFDNATGKNYRFGNFLRHPLVPDVIKTSLSVVYSFDSERKFNNLTGVIVLKTDDPVMGPTTKEIHQWFDSEEAHVLRFVALVRNLTAIEYEKELGIDLYNVIVHKKLQV